MATGAAPPPTTQSAMQSASATTTVLLVGNPNAGKTTLFNALTGLRAKTANFPGTTVERRSATLSLEGRSVRLVDLPGLYSLTPTSPEQELAREALAGAAADLGELGAVVVLVDATNIERNLYLASEVIELGRPTVVALTMFDVARRQELDIDVEGLSRELKAPVVPVAALKGEGVRELRAALARAIQPRDGGVAVLSLPVLNDNRAKRRDRFDWAERVGQATVRASSRKPGRRTDALDRVLTHPWSGLLAFLLVMFGVFYLIFSLASVPMDLLDALFGRLAAWVTAVVPAGPVQSLLADGVVAGVGSVLVFLPQICILFLVIALLEDSGYLSRAALVMDRLMRRVGLPGKAFIPMLSAHACALPAIMSTRVIEHPRDRLVTILVLPLMTCSARLPVYAMVTALLFPNAAFKGALVFAGAYSLGIFAALAMAFVFKRTILPGESQPLVIELPLYRWPSMRNALITMIDRATVFLKSAGTIILAIAVILWWLSHYPRIDASQIATANVAVQVDGDLEGADAAEIAAAEGVAIAREQLAQSYAGRIGRTIEPVLRPLGFDWRIGVGIVSSFAAREVLVSSLAIIYGVGDVDVETPTPLLDRMRAAKRPDGSPVFTTATCASLLVFFVLAMQCLPTQAVTRRETNSWKWAGFQFAYMTVLAYVSAGIVYQGLTALGVS